MSFNMTAMRMTLGSEPVRIAHAPAAHTAALPCFSGLGVANRLCLHAPGSHRPALCEAGCITVSAILLPLDFATDLGGWCVSVAAEPARADMLPQLRGMLAVPGCCGVWLSCGHLTHDSAVCTGLLLC